MDLGGGHRVTSSDVPGREYGCNAVAGGVEALDGVAVGGHGEVEVDLKVQLRTLPVTVRVSIHD